MPRCASCGGELKIEGKVGRRESCDSCGSDLHACRQCRFFDLNHHHQCLEPQAELVIDKEQANFCEYFELGDGGGSTLSSADTKRSLEKLFRK